ncbi:MAG: thiamine diphosphokinase [Spirochaetaceae bacterium]|jgi:thiamine pyrophosphokinase|nr:thiamine diphosphokinase [Spirochaetaceae bacterium]
MRGIVFIGGEGPGPELSRRILDGAGPALIVAADSGLHAAEAAGVSPEWIIGDMDSVDFDRDPRALERYPPERVLRYPHAKDYTDTELALSLLRERGCTGIWLLGGGGGRTDHLLALASLFERREKPERWFTAREEIRSLDPGEEALLNPAPRGPVSVFPLGTGPWKAESGGLRWPLGEAPWRRGFFGISNEALPGAPLRVRALEGSFLVLFPLPVL